MSQIIDDIRGVFRRRDDVLTQLIVLNIALFVLLGGTSVVLFIANAAVETKASTAEFLRQNFFLSSNLGVFLRHPWTLITHFFSHQQPFHLISNLLVLFWFGQLIQEYLGSGRLLSLYILGGIAGGAIFLLAFNALPAFASGVGVSLLGASGACMAIVVGAATLLPNYCFNLLLIGSVRLVYIAGAYVLFSFLNLQGSNPGGNLAHLGGGLMGYLFITQLRHGRDLGKPIQLSIAWVKKLFKPKSGMQATYNRSRAYETVIPSGAKKAIQKTAPGKKNDQVNQAEVDAILDKVLESGYNSLSADEKRKLEAAAKGDGLQG